MLEAVDGFLPIITYEKKKAKEQFLNTRSFASMDVKSFNSQIGFITNLASNLIAMKARFPDDSPEAIEIKRRIDLLRKYQGDCIDQTKGIVFVMPPKVWFKRQKYIQPEQNDSPERLEEIRKINAEIGFNNRICCDKKAYFFGYVYPEYLAKYRAHKKKYNKDCMLTYRCSMKDLKSKPNKTLEEKKFLSNYYKYMPLLKSNCTMNILCQHIEDMEFDNKWNKNDNNFDCSCLMSGNDFVPSEVVLNKIRKIIRYYNKMLTGILLSKSNESFEYSKDVYFSKMDYLYEACRNDILSVDANKNKIIDNLIYFFYKLNTSYTKTLLWSCFGDEIFENVKSGRDSYTVPVEDENGEEYLGRKYSLKRVERQIDI